MNILEINYLRFWKRHIMMGGRSLMKNKPFANISIDHRWVVAETVSKLIDLGDKYGVIFVPYRPVILKFLLDTIPDENNSGFTQSSFADACAKKAEEMGVLARGGKPLQITQKTVSNYCNPSMDGTRPDTDILEVMSEVLGVHLVPGLDRSLGEDGTQKVLDYIKKLHS